MNYSFLKNDSYYAIYHCYMRTTQATATTEHDTTYRTIVRSKQTTATTETTKLDFTSTVTTDSNYKYYINYRETKNMTPT